MKKLTIIFTAFALSAFYYADDILGKTGLSDNIVKNKVLHHALDYEAANNNSTLNIFGMDGDEAFSKKMALAFATTKSIVTGQRSDIVKQFGGYVKKYYNSPQFKNDFAELLGPEPNRYKDSSYYQAQYDSAIKYAGLALEMNKKTFSRENADAMKADMNKNLSASDAALKKAMEMIEKNPQLLAQSGMTKEEFVAKMTQGQAKMKEGKKEAGKQFDENMSDKKNKEQIEKAQKAYEETIAEAKEKRNNGWASVPQDAKNYYEKIAVYKKKKDYKANIRQTLTVFLNETADVDFTATLKTGSSTKQFEKAAYERKSNIWKACYRAGSDATKAAREFAQQWLTELK